MKFGDGKVGFKFGRNNYWMHPDFGKDSNDILAYDIKRKTFSRIQIKDTV